MRKIYKEYIHNSRDIQRMTDANNLSPVYGSLPPFIPASELPSLEDDDDDHATESTIDAKEVSRKRHRDNDLTLPSVDEYDAFNQSEREAKRKKARFIGKRVTKDLLRLRQLRAELNYAAAIRSLKRDLRDAADQMVDAYKRFMQFIDEDLNANGFFKTREDLVKHCDNQYVNVKNLIGRITRQKIAVEHGVVLHGMKLADKDVMLREIRQDIMCRHYEDASDIRSDFNSDN